MDCLDTLVPCPDEQCSLKGTFLNGDPWKLTCAGCTRPLGDFKVMKLFGPRQELLRTKILTGREWLTAHHCKLNAPFNFSPEAACARVESDPQHGLTLRNVSQETFLYRSPGTSSYSTFPPGTGLVLRVGTRLQFGAGGAEGEVVW